MKRAREAKPSSNAGVARRAGSMQGGVYNYTETLKEKQVPEFTLMS